MMGFSTLHCIVASIVSVWVTVLYIFKDDIHINESCVEHWESWICRVGNIAGLCSSLFWSCALIPQVWLNYRRKSTDGLSLRWAVANVAASVVNLNFVLRVSVPLYVTISAIYMPILELLILFQFSMTAECRSTRLVASFFCILLVLGILLGILFRDKIGESNISGSFMWVAVVLWSIESFPQLWMNARRQATHGQASETVLVTFLGKTTDFISMVSLDLPLQYRIMTYFSTTSAYTNIIQYLYYKSYRRFAYGVCLLIVMYSLVMFVKIGILLAIVITLCFLFLLFGGYKVELCLLPEPVDSVDDLDCEPLLA